MAHFSNFLKHSLHRSVLLYCITTAVVSGTVIILWNHQALLSPSTLTLFKLLRWSCIVLLSGLPIVLFFSNQLYGIFRSGTTLLLKSPLRLKIHLSVASIVCFLLLYASTGTLSPYANLCDRSYIYTDKCNNLFNGDYGQFTALYYLIDGKEKSSWQYSVVLRRILYNVIAYPLMKLTGHDTGGVIINIVLALVALFTLALFFYHTAGEIAGIAALWLFGTFPGIAYYVGQPFLYGLIAPATVLLYIILYKMQSVNTPGQSVFYSLAAGILCTGYDFFPFVIPAIVIVLFRTKKSGLIIPSLLSLVTPFLIWLVILTMVLKGSFSSENSLVYTTVINSWISGIDLHSWFSSLRTLPSVFLKILFSSTFYTIPFFCVAAFILMKKAVFHNRKHGLSSVAIFASTLLLFLIINGSPPYQTRWMMQGAWIARIYEPVFIAFIAIAAVSVQAIYIYSSPAKKIVTVSIFCGVCLFNSFIILGPLFNDPFSLSSTVYWNFYQHFTKNNMKDNLNHFGRHPLGFCKHYE